MVEVRRIGSNNIKISKSRNEYRDNAIIRAQRLRRVKEGNKTRIVGASESEISEIKQQLDTNILRGYKEEQSKKQLRRLGFLYG